MSKTKENAGLPTDALKTKKGEKITKERLDSISAQMADHWKRNRQKVVAIVVLAVAAIAILGAPAAGGSFAFLYIFGQFGKFSGRMDGDVMMRNGRGRGFVVPALVRNTYTMTARGLLSILSSGYRALTAAQVAAWRAFTMDSSNRFGQTVAVKGKDAYVRLNANLINIGQATIVTPPVLGAVDGITDVSTVAVDASAQTAVFVFGVSPTAANTSHKLFATRPLSNGITRPSASEFRLIDVIPTGSATPYDFAAAYIAKFGALTGTAGNKIFIQLYAVNDTTGQMTPSVGASGVIVP